MGPILVKPKSTGTIRLASADPLAKPIIDPRYLSDPEGADRKALLTGLRMLADMTQAPALKGLLGDIARPVGAHDLDDRTLELALATTSHTLYHPTTTCRMGSDEASVVDPQLRVRGVAGLRVADASVMPTIIRGHTHAPSVLIGERPPTSSPPEVRSRRSRESRCRAAGSVRPPGPCNRRGCAA